MRIILSLILCAPLLGQALRTVPPRRGVDQVGYVGWQLVGVGALATRPATCTANQHFYVCNGTGCPSNGAFYYCTATDTWTSSLGPISDDGTTVTVTGRNLAHVRTAPAGTHWKDADWVNIPYVVVAIASGDPAVNPRPNHTRVRREGTIWYMLNFRGGTPGVAWATSTDGIHFYQARTHIAWESPVAAYCGDPAGSFPYYRWDFVRSASGQFTGVGSCGEEQAARFWFSTIYER